SVRITRPCEGALTMVDHHPEGTGKLGFLALTALLITTLAACSHTQPGVEVRTQTVYVEVPAPCPATRPERPPPLGKLPEHAQAALAAALAALAAYSAPGMYADQAEAWFDQCATEE